MINKEIIAMCKNFYKIVNFEPLEGDKITTNLIRIYQEYIFHINIKDEEAIESVKKLDSILGKYIDDYIFRKEMQKEISKIKLEKDSNIVKEFINKLIQIFNNYEEYTTRVIYISRWI